MASDRKWTRVRLILSFQVFLYLGKLVVILWGNRMNFCDSRHLSKIVGITRVSFTRRIEQDLY